MSVASSPPVAVCAEASNIRSSASPTTPSAVAHPDDSASVASMIGQVEKQPSARDTRRAARTPRRPAALHSAASKKAFLKAFKSPRVYRIGLNAEYSDPEAGVALRSEDGVVFRVPSHCLKGTSDVFADMLEAFQRPTAAHVTKATGRAVSTATEQPPIDIEAPAIILRHFCDLLTDTILLPLHSDARCDVDVVITTSHPTQRTMSDTSVQTNSSAPISTKANDDLPITSTLEKLQNPETGPSTPPKAAPARRQPLRSSQHFIDLFRSPYLSGPEAGIRRLTLLLDLLTRFQCKPELFTRALEHYDQSIPYDPWGAFVLFAKWEDYERCKRAIGLFGLYAPCGRQWEEAVATCDHKVREYTESGVRLMIPKVSRGDEVLYGDPHGEADSLYLADCQTGDFGVNLQRLTVERAEEVPLGYLLGYIRALDRWKTQYLRDHVDPIANARKERRALVLPDMLYVVWRAVADDFRPVGQRAERKNV